jgi:hypothetical protein
MTLIVNGPFGSFPAFWRLVNNPTGQVFLHPMTGEIVYDLAIPRAVADTPETSRDFLIESAAEQLNVLGSTITPALLEAETASLKAAAARTRSTSVARLSLTWAQALFLPTRAGSPRRTKKARSIRKRLAKRLVKLAGYRFFT